MPVLSHSREREREREGERERKRERGVKINSNMAVGASQALEWLALHMPHLGYLPNVGLGISSERKRLCIT